MKAGPAGDHHLRQPRRGTYHNIAVYTANPGGDADLDRRADQGSPQDHLHQRVHLTAGKYAFRCDFHPTTMLGTFNVVNP